MRYESLKEFKAEDFRRLTGVKRTTFEKMVEILKEAEKKTYNKCYENFAGFGVAIHAFFFEDIPKMTQILKKRINDNFQCIELNSICLAIV